MRFNSLWISVAGILLLGGCLAPHTPARPPGRFTIGPVPSTEAANPEPTPNNARLPAREPDALPLRALLPSPVRFSFTADAPGSVPADWVDVTEEGTWPAWVYRGKWGVEPDENGNAVLMHRDIRRQPAVSFLRYRGAAWQTPDGQVPTRYRAEMSMRPLESPHNYPPIGDQGVQFFYRSPSEYLEIIVKPTAIEVWEARQGVPQSGAGWYKLWERPLITRAGDVRRIGAVIDRQALTLTALLDGVELTTVRSESLREGPAWLALRGIGNVVSFDDIELAHHSTPDP